MSRDSCLVAKWSKPLRSWRLSKLTKNGLVGEWGRWFDDVSWLNNMEAYAITTKNQRILVRLLPSRLSHGLCELGTSISNLGIYGCVIFTG